LPRRALGRADKLLEAFFSTAPAFGVVICGESDLKNTKRPRAER
jgi:hypothetical protein